MANVNSIIRLARNAVDLLINGAVRQIEGNFADSLAPECWRAVDELAGHLVEECESWIQDAGPEDSLVRAVRLDVSWFPPSSLIKLANAISEAMDNMNVPVGTVNPPEWLELDRQFKTVCDELTITHGMDKDELASHVACPEA